MPFFKDLFYYVSYITCAIADKLTLVLAHVPPPHFSYEGALDLRHFTFTIFFFQNFFLKFEFFIDFFKGVRVLSCGGQGVSSVGVKIAASAGQTHTPSSPSDDCVMGD